MRGGELKNVCIAGFGKSGVSLCNLLLSLGKSIKVSDSRKDNYFSQELISEFKTKGVEFEFGGHSNDFIKGSQLLILSPGISQSSSVNKICSLLGIPCIGEIEFSFWFNKAKIIAITGTNGKTTTARLTYEVLKQKRKRVFLGGNIGIPFSSFVLNTKKGDLVVLEVSSFQLETILRFKPKIAVLLNVEPDHLDRYKRFEDYCQTKFNIFKNQQSSDLALINRSLIFREKIKKLVKAKINYFSEEFSNENLSCVYRIVKEFGLTKTDCIKAFSLFPGLPHRLQFIRKVNGVQFINDSKATNVASTIWALKQLKCPVVLIAGGKDKGLDYSEIVAFKKRIRKINLYGEAAFRIKEVLNNKIHSEVFTTLENAVSASYKEAILKDIVLFSPMCSSFDLFSNYAERGNRFMEIVNNL